MKKFTSSFSSNIRGIQLLRRRCNFLLYVSVKIKELFDSVSVAPGELVSKKFWTTHEASLLDKMMPHHIKTTFLVRLLLVVCISVSTYFLLGDISAAGYISKNIMLPGAIGVFIIWMFVLLNYENQKRIERKVYT